MMRSNGLPLVVLLAALLAACADQTSPTDPGAAPEPSFARALNPNLALGHGEAPGHLVVFKSKKGIPEDFPALVASLGGELKAAHPQIGVASVTGLTAEAAAQLARGHGIRYVEPDVTVSVEPRLAEPLLAEPVRAIVQDVGTASASDPTGAARFGLQWNLLAIKAPAAWAAGRLGSPAVDVAILDTGIDYLYPDLVGRVDLSRSISLVPSDDSVVMELFPDRHPVTDLQFHGTHVAATVSSNALVAAGVTSGVTLIGVKVLGRTGLGPFSGIFNGIIYATDAGAEVINMSLGLADVLLKKNSPGVAAVLNRVVHYATGRGVTVVVAAGNAATDLDHDGNAYNVFCSTAGVICVSATGPTASASLFGPWENVDAPAVVYTNFGTSAINVAAPGGNFGGVVWAACSTTSLSDPVCQTGIFIKPAAGTSMAAPHVAGLAALLVEQYGRRPGRIKTALQQAADDLGKPGADPFYGKGRINVPRALGIE